MKTLRRPLFWYNSLMWALSGVFAYFLIALGALVMSDIPTAGKRIERGDFVDQVRLAEIQSQIDTREQERRELEFDLEDAEFLFQTLAQDYRAQRESFSNWLSTRSVTAADSENPEVLARVRVLDTLKEREREVGRDVETLTQTQTRLDRELAALRAQTQAIEVAAREPYERALDFETLKVFGLRLALTLPLLAVAGALIVKKRKSPYWPIYRGFVIFALFAFFVELVPYLPSYGGYVRFVVGLALVLAFAHFAVRTMTRYLQRKQSEESRPEAEKRNAIDYETAIKKIADGVCPSCDRGFGPVRKTKGADGADAGVDYCVHCGFNVFRKCASCGARDNSFHRFCGTCGVTSSGGGEAAQGA